MKPRVRLHSMRVIPSSLHLSTVLAYTMRELPRADGRRVFEYVYIEARRVDGSHK